MKFLSHYEIFWAEDVGVLGSLPAAVGVDNDGLAVDGDKLAAGDKLGGHGALVHVGPAVVGIGVGVDVAAGGGGVAVVVQVVQEGVCERV